jgi:hypothetical protein
MLAEHKKEFSERFKSVSLTPLSCCTEVRYRVQIPNRIAWWLTSNAPVMIPIDDRYGLRHPDPEIFGRLEGDGTITSRAHCTSGRSCVASGTSS